MINTIPSTITTKILTAQIDRIRNVKQLSNYAEGIFAEGGGLPIIVKGGTTNTFQIGVGFYSVGGVICYNNAVQELVVNPTGTQSRTIIASVDLDAKSSTINIVDSDYVLRDDDFLISNTGKRDYILFTFDYIAGSIVNEVYVAHIFTDFQNVVDSVVQNTVDIDDLNSRVNVLEDLHNDTDWINLTYEPGYQPITPTHYARYRIRDDILWVQGSVALVAGGSLPSTAFTAVSGIDLTGYFVTAVIQLDSLSINGGSNGAATYKTTVESDGSVTVAETPSTAATGATKSSYTSLDTIVLLDRA